MSQDIKNRINKITWNASLKTVEDSRSPPPRLHDHSLDRAALNFDNGDFSGVTKSLTSDDNQLDLENDPQGLTLVSLSYLGLDQYHEALNSLDKTLDLLKQHQAKIEVNRSIALGFLQQYDDAIAALHRAHELAPELWSIPLGEIALLENRQAPQDRQRVKQIGQNLIASYPEWQTNGIGYYLAFDVDYSLLRQDPDFFAQTFGVHPETLITNLQKRSTS